MASGFVAVVALRKNSDFSEFKPENYSPDAYDEQAVLFLDNEVVSSMPLIEVFLEETFVSGNVGALREQLSRSLSVGDVVKLEHVRTGKTFFATVEGCGWKHYVAG